MPNQLERELSAIHSSIAELKRRMVDCVNVNHYAELEKQIDELEEKRIKLLNEMEVEL